jgi:hypothetical protein
MRFGRFVTLAFLCGFASKVQAQPFPEQSLPDALRKWVPWALDGAEDRLCPAVGGAAVCLWPGRLVLNASAQGGGFTLDVVSDRPLDLPLPGGDKAWPQSVLADGKPVAVLGRGGAPVVRLAPGPHKIEGRLPWDRIPDSLAVPAAIAIVDLSVDGRAVVEPRREASGLLLLRQAGASSAGGENLQLKVFRNLSDGIPLFVETRILFEVSGKAREVVLEGALLAGAVPIAVAGELPARLDADRKLRVQVRAGTFTVRVTARLSGRPDAFSLPKAPAPWPAQEVWVFVGAERLRQVELSGAPPIDASRTDLPEEWRPFPAFLLEGATELKLKETRRGEPDAAPDQVALSRTLWLDEDGGAFTVRDTFTGRLGRTTRLNVLAPAELGRVAIGGEGQLVTKDPGPEAANGVELRQAALSLQADLRLPRAGAAPAVGWGVNVQSLAANLQLPPGWRLLATTGVDQASGSWTSRWNLWGFFFVLLTALGVARLFGPRWGLVALATLVLLHGESGAPRLAWLSLVLTMAVLNVAPRGVLKILAATAWGLSLFVLVMDAAPFVVQQIRGGLFPQIGASTQVADSFVVDGVPGGVVGGMVGGLPDAMPAPPATVPPEAEEQAEEYDQRQNAAPAAPPPPPQAMKAPRPEPRRMAPSKLPPQLNSLQSLAPASVSNRKAYEQDPHAVIQTGAGIPSWSWASYRLTWSGPVAKDQRMRLFLLSPGMNLLLALVRVALLTLLALRLAAAVLGGARWKRAAETAAAPAAVLLAAVFFLPGTAGAQEGGLVPGPQMLQELRNRLIRPPACAPSCVATANLRIVVGAGELRFQAEVHAGALAAWPVPGPAESWVPRSVTVDGAPAEGHLARLANGFLHLRVTPGIHQVVVAGPLPPKDSLTLQFGEKPHRASVTADGWQVDGVREDGTADESIQLSRKLTAGSAAATGGGGYEPWLEVTRVLDIGVSWGVETIVRRVSPAGVPVVVKVPLLKGMLVTDAEHQVKDGEVLVTLGRDQLEARWSATLPPVEGTTVTLKAPEGKFWSEVWMVDCGLAWQCEAAGLPPVSRVRDGRLAPEFRPWPGESLDLTFRHPKGVEGRTMTIDRATLQLVPGTRLEDATLGLQIRASRGGPLTLTLPDGAEVQEVKVKGVDRPIRPEANKLTLTIEPGDQAVKVAWRTSGGFGVAYRAPAVSLGAPAVNAQISVQVPADHWILFVRGPSWGPAVLFWGTLLFVVLVAAVLARAPGSPLRTAEWILLALGLTQIPLFGAAVVAGWFLVLAWRRERRLESGLLHDLLQIALVFWTLAAMACLYAAAQQGLALRPDMQVAGGGSTDTLLQWYQDRIDGALPRPQVLSLPLWVYRLTMLAWSLWLALRLIRWLQWGWGSFSSGGLWRPWQTPKAASPVTAPPTSEPPDAPPPADAA